jgi:hypothetical protein
VFIYFIRQHDTGFLKIGKANDPLRRMHNIQVGSPQYLQMLGYVRRYGEFEEKYIHDVFLEHRFRGEWFREEGKLQHFTNHLLNWFHVESQNFSNGHPPDPDLWRTHWLSLERGTGSAILDLNKKECRKCGETKSLSRFYFTHKRALPYCMECQRQNSAEKRRMKKEGSTA